MFNDIQLKILEILRDSSLTTDEIKREVNTRFKTGFCAPYFYIELKVLSSMGLLEKKGFPRKFYLRKERKNDIIGYLNAKNKLLRASAGVEEK